MQGINLSVLKDTIATGNFHQVYDEFQKARETVAVGQNGEATDPRLLIRDETNFWLGIVVAMRYMKTPTKELEDAMKSFNAGLLKRKEVLRISTKHFQDRVDNIEKQCDVWFTKTQMEKIRASTDAVDCGICQKNRESIAKHDAETAAAKGSVLHRDPSNMPPI